MCPQGPTANLSSALTHDSLHVLKAKGQPVVERTRSGTRAFAGADLAAACRLLAGLGNADPSTNIERVPTRELIAALLAAKVEELTVADSSGEARFTVVPDAPVTDSCPLVMIVDAGDRPGRDPESSRELFRLRRERVVVGEISPLALDSWLAFDQDVYVACHSEMIERESWPRFTTSLGPKGERLAAFEFFTTIEAAARRAGGGGRVMAMGGRDALRWAFAAPVVLDSIVVDPGEPTQIAIGRYRVLSILFPASLPFEDPATLPALALDELTSFMPIDTSLALVSGTLLRGCQDIIGPSGPAPAGRTPCGFTSQTAFVAAMSSNTFALANAVSPTEHPPFRSWLELARESGGVILDPASPAPLELDVTQIFLLALWAERRRAIQPEDFTEELTRELRLGHISTADAAKIAANWPSWIVGEIESRDGSETRPWIASADGHLALFSSEQRLARFVAIERTQARLRDAWRHRAITQSVNTNLLELARREYSGVVFDPGTAELILEGETLEIALAEVQRLLWPQHLRPRRRAA